jgi:hypothetical protein
VKRGVIGPEIGQFLNKLQDKYGRTPEARRDVYVNLVHHLAEEHAFMLLEGVATPEDLLHHLNEEFEEGLRCAARHHQKLCKTPNCAALEALRKYIRYAPKLTRFEE